MQNSTEPKISVLIPSLNGARFLRETLDSIFAQTLKSVEVVVVDGGSTDGTLDILKEYPQILWISERETDENPILEALRKAFVMSRGRYIMQCCVSDGFLSRNWFEKCAKTLDEDEAVSLVWGLPQYMDEESALGKITNPEFLRKSPPQKKDFLPFWLAYGYGYHEGNYCVRRQIYDACFPQRNQPGPFKEGPHITFLYEFNTKGYLPYFLPMVANFGRLHSEQRGVSRGDALGKDIDLYMKMKNDYKKQIVRCHVTHYFRNGVGDVIGEIEKKDLRRLRWAIFRHYLKYKVSKRLIETQERL